MQIDPSKSEELPLPVEPVPDDPLPGIPQPIVPHLDDPLPIEISPIIPRPDEPLPIPIEPTPGEPLPSNPDPKDLVPDDLIEIIDPMPDLSGKWETPPPVTDAGLSVTQNMEHIIYI